jgi:exosome complex component RRP46
MEVRLRDELVDRAALEINFRPVRGLPGPATKALIDSLSSILTPVLLLNRHPRSLVQLSLQTMSLPSTRYSKPFRTFTEAESTDKDDDIRAIDEDLAGSDNQRESVVEKAAAINAAVCALVDAAIDMKAMLCAVGLAIMPSDVLDKDSMDGQNSPRIVLDPTAEEERDATATLCIAFSFGEGMGGVDGDVCYFDMCKGYLDEEQVRS